MNSESVGDDSSAIPQATVDTSAMTPIDAASAAISTQTRLQRFREPLHYLFAPYFGNPEPMRKKQIYDIPPTCRESKAPNTTSA